MNQYQPTTVAQINALPDKAPVYRFIGTVNAIYDPKSGTSPNGDWHLQNAMLRDSEGGIIKCLFKDHPPIQATVGSLIELACYEGQKGLSGLYARDDSYNGQTTRILSATKTCQVTLGGPLAPANEPNHYEPGQDDPDIPWSDEPGAAQPQAPQQAPQQRQAPPAKKTATDAFKRARVELVKIANLHLTCAIAVERMEAPVFLAATGHEMSREAKQAATASVFIRAERSGLVEDMPTSPLKADDFN